MATPAQWVAGARVRTLPAAVAPVFVGTGVAAGLDGFRPVPALLAPQVTELTSLVPPSEPLPIDEAVAAVLGS